jgi:hypothetical protein
LQDPKAPINLVRLWAVIPGVKPALLYDMLNNHTYRKVRCTRAFCAIV